MTPFKYNPEQFDIYIGNDVDQNNFSLTIRERYRLIMTKKMPAKPQELYNFIRNQFPGRSVIVGYEAGPTGFGLYDYLIGRDMPCVLLSPSGILKPANERVKTNRIDSKKIATMLTDGQFHPVRVPDGPYRELRHLTILRNNYVKLQRTAKQRIKSLLLYTGLNETCRDIEQNWSNYYIQHLKTIDCTPAIRLRLDKLLEDLNYARKQLLDVTKQLRKFYTSTPEINEHIRNLRTIPGIGFVTATTVLGRIGNPVNLHNQRELAAFCGLTPREHSTGDNVRRGGITGLGDATLRSILIEASWMVIQNDTELGQFYNRIKSKNSTKSGSLKAIVAVAHKLTLRIYRVLVERRAYIVH